jgi:hypothetical protein
MTARDLWERHRQHLSRIPALGLRLDVSLILNTNH